MAFGYTLLLTENPSAEQVRRWYGYNTSAGGMLLHMRLDHKLPDGGTDAKAIDAEIFLPGDQVSGMGSISWTTLIDQDLGRGARRVVRSYATPAGNVLLHRYTKADFTWAKTTRTLYVDEHVDVLPYASLSGTDIIRVAGAGQQSIAVGRTSITTSNNLNGNSGASWQDVLVAPASSALQVQFTAKANDSVHANLVLSAHNTLGSTFFVESRILLDSTEIAWSRRWTDNYLNGTVDLSVSADISGLSAGTRTLKAQLLIGGTPTTLACLSGTHRGKIEYRLFR